MFLSSMLRFPGQVVKVARHQTIDLAIIKIDGEMERSAPLVNVGTYAVGIAGMQAQIVRQVGQSQRTTA